MNYRCPKCNLRIEIDEGKYEPGSVLKMACPRCDEALSIPIPMQQKKAEVIPPEPTKKDQQPAVPEPVVTGLPVAEQPVQPDASSSPETVQSVKKSGGNGKLIAVVSVLTVMAASVFGGFYYKNVYLPEKIDREAPRYYTFADATVLRSSRVAGADFNKIGSVPYGSELITYEHGTDWSSVKYGEEKGYIASNYILTGDDFFLLNSIFGDAESKECVSTSKCRLAVLKYFKDKGLRGKLPEADVNNQWQVFCRPANVKPNNVSFPRLRDKNSKFTDFAVVIKNLGTGQRRLVIFGFEDDETPFLINESDAPEQGYIQSLTNRNGQLYVSWTN
jgi:hypothetical protein